MIEDISGVVLKNYGLAFNSICNFVCTYCVSDKEVNYPDGHIPANRYQPVNFATLVLLNSIFHLEEVRLTGGEPTLYPELAELIYLLKEMVFRKLLLRLMAICSQS